MRWEKLGGLTVVAALAMGVGTADTAVAQETPAPDRIDGRDVDAVRDRLAPVSEFEATGAASRAADWAAAADAAAAAAALPPGLCYGPQYADANEPGDTLLDATSYGLGYDCPSSTWVLGVQTVDSYADSALGWVDLSIDTDGNLGTGCVGADFVAVIVYDLGFSGGMFRTPSCDPNGWRDVAGANLMFVRPAANQIGLAFSGAPIATTRTLRWQSSITHINANDPIDFMPDSINQWRSSPGNPCGGRCFFLTNGTTGGPADVAFHDPQRATHFLVGDWNADGVDSFGFRYLNTYALKNAHAPTAPDVSFAYGQSTDTTFVGDWNGDGVDTLAVRRGNLYYLKNTFGGGATDIVQAYGRPDDVILVGDWDGDGDDTLAVRRGSTYYIKNSFGSGPADYVVAYGRAGDRVLVGDWDGDGDDTLGVRRDSTYFLKNTIAGGVADSTFSYGKATDVTFVGDWNADNRDTLGVRR